MKMIRFVVSKAHVLVPHGINLETWDFLFFFLLDLAVLGVSLTERSTKDVEKAFQDIARKLNLSESPPMQNLQSVPEVKDYLMKNNLRTWVLVIDADRIKFGRGHQSEESRDYRQLFETVANHVGKIRKILLRIVIPNRQTREILCTIRES